MTTTYLESKPRYEILDGLRGVAALIVVAFHLFETYSRGPVYQTLNHGYLAVDFFFVLSGFVIGYAYDDRWSSMSLKDFFKRRLVRLHPMVIMGTLIGGALFYFSESPAFSHIMQTPLWQVLFVMLLGCMMIPTPPSWDIRGWGETNSLNGPAWSLMWEYVANILYALFIRRFSKVALGIFVLLTAYLTIDIALNIDTFGLLANRSYAAYTFIGGWSITPDQMYIGATRLLYPFFAGLLLSRINKLIQIKRGFWWCSLFIAIILVMPRIGGETNMWMNGMYEAVCVLMLFPLIVATGAGSRVTGTRSVAVCKFFGEISYPLYITHYPLIYMQTGWARNHPDAPLGVHIFVGVSVFFLSITIAYASLKLYDEPVREWLKRIFLMKTKRR
ncbi:MAG: acyltransferase [Bacteroides graminisolvens]|nr:acyltransferase [Bacteroides graminisolvens]